MLRVLLACLALVALARAANPTTKYCNLTITCVNQGGACDLENGEECAEGLYCDTTGDKTCKAAATLGNDCSGTGFQCWNADYELTCDALGDKTCKYAAIYGPGEACSSDTTNYLNGGCVLGSCVSGKCTGSGNGDACDGKNCTVGLYCTTNGTCAARKTEGTSCASSIECQAGLYCATKGTNAGKCATPFQGASGDACDVDQTFDGVYLDCGANLWCSGGSCASLTGSDGSDCSDDGTCPDNQGCVCHVDKSGNTVTIDGPGTCKLATVNPKSLLNDLKSFESCALNNNCFDLTGSAIVGLTHGGPNQCIAQCINSVGTEFAKLGETFNKCDLNAIIAEAGGSGSGSSAAIFPSFVAIVALFVYAIFA